MTYKEYIHFICDVNEKSITPFLGFLDPRNSNIVSKVDVPFQNSNLAQCLYVNGPYFKIYIHVRKVHIISTSHIFLREFCNKIALGDFSSTVRTLCYWRILTFAAQIFQEFSAKIDIFRNRGYFNALKYPIPSQCE